MQLDLPEWLKADYDYMAFLRRPKKAAKPKHQSILVKTKEVEAGLEEEPRAIPNAERAIRVPEPVFSEAALLSMFSVLDRWAGRRIGHGERHPPPSHGAKSSEQIGANDAKQAAVANLTELGESDKFGNLPRSSGAPDNPRNENI